MNVNCKVFGTGIDCREGEEGKDGDNEGRRVGIRVMRRRVERKVIMSVDFRIIIKNIVLDSDMKILVVYESLFKLTLNKIESQTSK